MIRESTLKVPKSRRRRVARFVPAAGRVPLSETGRSRGRDHHL